MEERRMLDAQSRSQLRRLEASDEWEDNRPFVVLISGKAGVGKTTLANTLTKVVQQHEDTNKSIIMKQPIAWGVKQTALNMGWDGEKDAKGRRLLQGVGKIGREYNPDVWVDITVKAVQDTQYHYSPLEGVRLSYVWIDDWRFKNEIAVFEKLDYMFRIYTVRVIAPQREILRGTPEALDISEIDLDDYSGFDFIVDNNEDLDKLWVVANMIYKRIQ
jgi:Cdc6-like AAA superfamily ATPase